MVSNVELDIVAFKYHILMRLPEIFFNSLYQNYRFFSFVKKTRNNY